MTAAVAAEAMVAIYRMGSHTRGEPYTDFVISGWWAGLLCGKSAGKCN